MSKLLAILFSLFPLSYMLAQNHAMVNYTVTDGLPSSQVYDVIQDRFGYIWFTTDRGLSRYDGYSFENFDSDDGLPENVVFDFYPIQNGEIWCSTISSQLFKITGDRPQFIPYKFNDILFENAANFITTGEVLIDDTAEPFFF